MRQQVLDNTPWWFPGTHQSGSGHGLGRCNPYGYEKDPSVLGGTHQIEHERLLYYCANFATARYWVVCPEQHRGQLALCDGHAYQFTKRMSGICPRCIWPPEARQIDADMNDCMRRISGTHPLDPERARLISHLDSLRYEMDELIRRGVIKTGGRLELVEVS